MNDSNLFELPDGHARLRAVNKIPERLRRPVRAALFDIQRLSPAVPHVSVVTEGEVVDTGFGAPPVGELADLAPVPEVPTIPSQDLIDATDVYMELLVVAFVESWSYGKIIDVGHVRELPGDVYDALTTECRRLNAPDIEDPTETSASSGRPSGTETDQPSPSTSSKLSVHT